MSKIKGGATVYWIGSDGKMRVDRIEHYELTRSHTYESEDRIRYDFLEHMAVVIDSDRGLSWAAAEIARIRDLATPI
jgi:hypothetical protein